MNFKFDFGSSEEPENENKRIEITSISTDTKNNVYKELSPYKLVNLNEICQSIQYIAENDLHTLDPVKTDSKHINLCGVTLHFPENLEKQKNDKDDEFSDVLSNVYEGGAIVWECTKDLLNFIENNAENFHNKSILDLGCGLGILGVYALLYCKSHPVHFQDYNEEVINTSTIPTLLYNYLFKEKLQTISFNNDEMWNDFCEEYSKNIPKELTNKVSMFSASWKSMHELLDNESKYDIILSSETIYNTQHYPTLHGILEKYLSRNGISYFATKSHYFGVGGGLNLWNEFIKSKNIFKTEIVWTTLNCSLLRYILKIEFKS